MVMSTKQRRSGSFKPPLQKKSVDKEKSESEENLKRDIIMGEARLHETESEIQTLKSEGLNEEELQIHIEKLHEYNEVKDIGQMLLGRLAVLESVRTKDLYQRYGLELED